MTDIRTEVHEEIDRMTDEEVRGLQKYLATYPDPVAAAFRNAPIDDEPYTEEERRLVAEADEWLEQNGGKGIPHEEVMRDLGLSSESDLSRSIDWTRQARADIKKVTKRTALRIERAVRRLAETGQGDLKRL